MTRWPGQPFVLDDIAVIAYPEEKARLAGLEDARQRRETSLLNGKVMGLMTRTTIQRYVEGDGFYLQEGTIRTVYETAGRMPARRQVWRATPMEYPAPAGPQTTDDWLIIWNAHKNVRSSPLLRESMLVARMQPIIGLLRQEAGQVFSAQELLKRLYPEKVAQALHAAPTEQAGHHRLEELATRMIRTVLYDQNAADLLRVRLADHGLQLLQGHVVRRLKEYHGREEGTARTLYRVATVTEVIPDEPVQHDHSMVHWQKLYDEAGLVRMPPKI